MLCHVNMTPKAPGPGEQEGLEMSAPEVSAISGVAANLRCSKAHVYNAINGRVASVTALPAIAMGRRKLVRQTRWRPGNEATREVWEVVCLQSLEVDAVNASRRKS